jgi:hypothetical protein
LGIQCQNVENGCDDQRSDKPAFHVEDSKSSKARSRK